MMLSKYNYTEYIQCPNTPKKLVIHKKQSLKRRCMRWLWRKPISRLSICLLGFLITTTLYLSNYVPNLNYKDIYSTSQNEEVRMKRYLESFVGSMVNMSMSTSIKNFVVREDEDEETALENYGVSGQYYRTFPLSPPTFASDKEEFTKLFRNNPNNLEEISKQPLMRGIVAVIPNGVFAKGSGCNKDSVITQYVTAPPNSSIEYLDSYVLPLNDLGTSCEITNFIMEILPRLAQAKSFLHLPSLSLIIRGYCDQYVMQMLKAMGLSQYLHFKSRINVDAFQSKYQINSCIAPFMHRMLLKPAMQLLNIDHTSLVRTSHVSVLLRLLPLMHGSSITNIKSVVQLLNDRFAEVSVFEGSKKLAEVRKVFEESNIIIAVHGPVLYNIMYAQPNTQVVEIFATRRDGSYITDYNSRAINNIWRLCHVLGHRYYRMMEEPSGYQGSVNVNMQNFELMIDTLVADDDF